MVGAHCVGCIGMLSIQDFTYTSPQRRISRPNRCDSRNQLGPGKQYSVVRLDVDQRDNRKAGGDREMDREITMGCLRD